MADMLPKRACDLCYSKKISCDRQDPGANCDWCRHHQLTCTFNRARNSKRNAKPRIENSVFAIERSLSSKLQPIDSVLDRVMLDQATASSPSPPAQKSPPRPSDVSTKASFEQDGLVGPSIPLTCDGKDCLDRETAWQTLRLYEKSSVQYVSRLIDTVLFQDVIELAYSSDETTNPTRLARAQAQANVLALVAIMSSFKANADLLPRALGMKCASQALKILEATDEGATLSNLRTLCLLRLRCVFTGQLSLSLQAHVAASRLIMELGGHVVTPERLDSGAALTYSDRESRDLRNLFWQTYITDKQITMRTGMPPSIDDSLCDLELPDDLGLSEGHMPAGRKDASLLYGFLSPSMVGDIQLSILKSKVWQRLYSPSARQGSEAELLSAVRELDGEVEAWRVSIPLEIRPTFLIPDKSRIPPHKANLPPWVRHHATTLHLEYHHLFIIIHQASARYQFSKGSDSFEQAWSTSVQSSAALALEASRSTLLYLETVLDQLLEDMFWICIHYPVVALRTLFVNLVTNPTGPDAQSDLRLLRSTADLIKRMPISDELVSGEEYLRQMEEEVAELIQYVQNLTGP